MATDMVMNTVKDMDKAMVMDMDKARVMVMDPDMDTVVLTDIIMTVITVVIMADIKADMIIITIIKHRLTCPFAISYPLTGCKKFTS
uniref:Uncharacterized protein n=1 Tax=Panagrolaimus sp. JU765 TaxID=591449 RepID=A0AC34RPN4_9BILA